MNLNQINEKRELLNYEYSHLYNKVKHGGHSHLFPRRTLIQRNVNREDQSEYGVKTMSQVMRYASFERCVEEQEKRPGSSIVRLGRNSRTKRFDIVHIASASDQPDPRFLAHADESGNIETPETDTDPDYNVFQLVSNELTALGYTPDSLDVENPKGARPPASVLRDLAMRYNDIVPEEFAAAVVRHCELPRISDGENLPGKSPWKTPEEKEAWFDTPSAKAWVKENPTPSIFNLPTPEYIHRRG